MKERRKGIPKILMKVLADIISIGKWPVILIIALLAASSLNSYLLVEFINYITMAAAQFIAEDAGAAVPAIAIRVGWFLGGMLITKLVAQYYPLYRVKYNKKLTEHVNTSLKRKLGRIQYEYFESHIIYEKIDRVSRKALAGYEAALESVLRILEILLYMAVYTVYLSRVNPVFAVLVIVSIAFSGIITTRMSKLKHRVFVDVTRRNQKRDYLNRIPKDKTMHQEYQSGRLYGAVFERYRKAYEKAQDGYLKIHAYTILSEAKALLFFCLTMFFSYLYLSFRILDGFAEAGMMVSLIVIFDQLYGKAESLSYYISNRVEELLVVDEYFEMLDYEEAQEIPKALFEDNCIRFEDVTYCYPQTKRRALDELNIAIKKGEKVAIVGQNGSGKTTFCNILLGLLTQFDGSVKVGNERYTRQNPLPCQMIKSLGQDFNMYQISVEENIFLREQGEIPPGKLEEIQKKADMKDFVNSFPNGSDTCIGQLDEDGVEMSKGQEQRIATARLLSNDAPIWILDEPTAYLDPLAEIEAYRLILELSEQKTLLFVSHRLGFAPIADRIIVFDAGKVVEDGSHEELMKQDGIYAHMYELQKSWYQS